MKKTVLILSGLAVLAAGCEEPPAPATTPMTIEFASRPWDTGKPGGKELVSEHYQIFTTSRRPEILSYLPGFMEAAHANYLDITGLSPQPAGEPMPLYMMATRSEWTALTRSIVGQQWELYSNIQAGGFCYKGVCVFWDMGGVGSLSVASHEGLHQLLSRRMKDRLPMWLEEGLCASAEGYQLDGPSVRFTPGRNGSRYSDLRKAIVQDWWIPLEQLLPMDGGDALKLWPPGRSVGYYGQLWALAEFLRTDPVYSKRRARLLADAEAGRFHEALNLSPRELKQLHLRGRAYNRVVAQPLFKYYMTKDPAGFEKQYKAFARKLVGL